jgi:hypothetical protein
MKIYADLIGNYKNYRIKSLWDNTWDFLRYMLQYLIISLTALRIVYVFLLLLMITMLKRLLIKLMQE